MVIYIVLGFMALVIGVLLYMLNGKDKLITSLSESLKEIENEKSKLVSEKNDLQNTKRKIEEDKIKLFSIKKGDKALHRTNLVAKNETPQIHFDVIVEIEILEVTTKSVKVKATSGQSNNDWAKKNMKDIISYFEDKWLNLSDVELMMDDSRRRVYKLDQLG